MAEKHLLLVEDEAPLRQAVAERFLAESGCRWLAKPFRLGDLLRTAKEVASG